MSSKPSTRLVDRELELDVAEPRGPENLGGALIYRSQVLIGYVVFSIDVREFLRVRRRIVEALLVDIRILPECRRNGAVSRAIRSLLSFLRERGVEMAWTCVVPELHSVEVSLAFFRGLGFDKSPSKPTAMDRPSDPRDASHTVTKCLKLSERADY